MLWIASHLQGHRDRDRESLEIGDTDIEGGQAEQFRAFFRVAVETHGGATAAQLHDLHLAPGHAVQAGAQRLADRLFGSEPPGQARDLTPALAHLYLREDAFEKALAVSLIDLAHSIDLDDIDADRDVNASRGVQGRGQARQPCRPKQPVGNALARTAHQRREQDWRLLVHQLLSISAVSGCVLMLSEGSTEGAGPVPRPMPR